jgi:hypothetical protein
LYILMDFYLIHLRKVCLRPSRPNGHRVKHPLDINGDMAIVEAS